MKTFHTERDIEDIFKAGTREIRIDDDVVLTDLAREKALALGVRLTRVLPQPMAQEAVPPLIPALAQKDVAAALQPSVAAAPLEGSDEELARQVKAALISRLGPGVPDAVLDAAIHRALATE